jgi:tetratricopeptide (TPR) repeat protein
MKRLALILILAAGAFTLARAADNPVDDLFRQAQASTEAKKFDDAIASYERILAEHPEAYDRWFDAEVNIAQTLARKGDFAEAAKAAHLCLDGAPDLGAFDRAVAMTAQILSAQDKNVDRANLFLAFQQSGATGGKVNPMDAVGYPSQPAREQAFASARQQAGDDAPAARFRAFTYLYTGKPRDALAQFADAFRRNDNPYDLRNAGVELVTVGLRAVQGHRVGLDKAMQFVIYGPNGPDAKPGTADDLPDPFALWLTNVPPPGEGGMANLPADDLANLKKVRAAAALYTGDPLLPSDGVRRTAVSALQRTLIALDGWGAPGQKDWYVRLALGLGCPPPDEYTANTYLSGAAYAARGRGLNYAGLTALWTEIDADCKAAGLALPKHIDDVHRQFDGYTTGLARIQFPAPAPGVLKVPAAF